MKIQNVLLLSVGAALVYYYSQLVQAGDKVNIVFDGVQVKGLLNYLITLRVDNVSNANITINSMAGTVSLNGSEIGDVSDFTKVDIASNSQGRINVTLNPSLLSLPSAVLDLINNADKTLNFEVNGNVNISTLTNNVVVPFDLQKQIIIPV